MIAQSAFHAAQDRCRDLLISRGYQPVQPGPGSIIPCQVTLHLLGMRGDVEALCVRIHRTDCPVSEDIAEFLCWPDICMLRLLLAMDPGEVFLRCEVWVISPSGAIYCFEVTRDRQRHGGADMAEHAKNPANGGDLIFSLVDYPDRIAKRLNKKIERPGQRRPIPGQRGRL